MLDSNSKFCLIILQLEWMTAGDCKAGMHEVVVTKSTLDAIQKAKQENRSLWRVSSTVSESTSIYLSGHTLNLDSLNLTSGLLCLLFW